MTLTATTSKITHSANGVTTVWPFAFRIPTSAEAEVLVTSPDGVTTRVDPLDYTVTGLDRPEGGSVTLPLNDPPLAAGHTVTIRRKTALTQTTDLVTGAAFYAEDVEAVFDRHTMVDQDQQEQLDRALQVPVSDSAAQGILPVASLRANKALVFDATGNVTVSVDDYQDQASQVAASAAAAHRSEQNAEASAALALTLKQNTEASATLALTAQGAASIAETKALAAATAARASEQAAAADAAKVGPWAEEVWQIAVEASTYALTAETYGHQAVGAAHSATAAATTAQEAAGRASTAAAQAGTSATQAAVSAAAAEQALREGEPPPAASETVAGVVELATSVEALAGVDTGKAVTPVGLKAAVEARITALPAGPQGERGIQGQLGPQGVPGPKGEKGEKGDLGVSLFTRPGDYIFTVPAGVWALFVSACGGGGGGGSGYGNWGDTVTSGGAGGGAGSAREKVVGVTPGETIAITVGAGGTGAWQRDGGTGGTTVFGPYLACNGGGGGKCGGATTGGAGGAGGTGSTGVSAGSAGGAGSYSKPWGSTPATAASGTCQFGLPAQAYAAGASRPTNNGVPGQGHGSGGGGGAFVGDGCPGQPGYLKIEV